MSDSSEHSTPLLRSRPGADAGENPGLQSPATLAVLLGRAVGRRGPSFLVRETAARELEARRADWGYSTPVVSVDMLWNMAFVVASVVMLILTVDENPNVPLRLWIGGYALQCFMHVVLVWLEYRRRTRVSRSASMRGDRSRLGGGDEETGGARVQHPYEINESDEGDAGAIGMFGLPSRTSFTKRCESVNTMASFLWWIIGFYWIVSGGEQLLHNAPRLYWLTLVFLAFDVFFAIFCVVLACLIGIALCCCLPCIIAVLYSVAGQGGASDTELGILPKYIFNSSVCEGNSSVGAGVMVPVDNGNGYVETERTLLPEDAECCICLSSYEDGVELHALPCNHHFHATCIVKWLKMNATCPLCKYDILKADEQV